MKPSPVKPAPLVALTTDFGTEDPYVGVMKGVLLGICPHARLVDVTHGIPPQDVVAGRLALEAAVPYFPAGTIHLAVVDPGVGTGRAAIAVRTPRAVFVGPDNGLFSFLAEADLLEVRRIENRDYVLHPVSRTFHGRDVFAPAAAHLAAGVALSRLGTPVSAPNRLPLPTARTVEGGAVVGEVLTFDHFGNAVTSVRSADLPPDACRVVVAGRTCPLVSTYAAVADGEPLGLVGSTGRLEVSVRGGSARRELGLRRGTAVRVPPCWRDGVPV